MAENPNILRDLRSYLEYEIAEGRNRVALSDQMAAFIRVSPSKPALVTSKNASHQYCGTAVMSAKAASVPGVALRQQPDPTVEARPRRTGMISKGDDSMSAADAAAALNDIAGEIVACRLCHLCETRRKAVPGQGNPKPEIMFVGEGPGMDEDAAGLAFVGTAGQLLTRMIEAMGLTRDQVFIGNIVKCHPPGVNTPNRAPTFDEIEVCMPYLKRQIAILRPAAIVALGGVAVKSLTGEGAGITKLRGKWMKFEGIDLMPTFHPSYLLRSGADNEKKKLYWEVWNDLLTVLKHLGKEPPPREKDK